MFGEPDHRRGPSTNTPHDGDDGYDSVEWAANLSGSDGKVGMYGSSHVGGDPMAGRRHRTAASGHHRAGQHGLGLLRRLDLRGAVSSGWRSSSRGRWDWPRRPRANNDRATAASIKAAGADAGRWMAFLPYRDLRCCNRTTRRRPVVLRLDHPLDARRLLDPFQHPRPLQGSASQCSTSPDGTTPS